MPCVVHLAEFAAPTSSANRRAAKPRKLRSLVKGVSVRHQRSCAQRAGGNCSCTPSYQGQVWSPRERKPIRRTFATVAEAKAWRQEAQVGVRRGTLRAPSRSTVAEAAREWLHAASVGVVRTRSGDVYKPSALRTYQNALEKHLLPRLGNRRLASLSRHEVQDVVDELVAAGASASTTRNAVLPLRAIYRRAVHRDEVATNPTVKLALPAVRGRRDRVARPDEASRVNRRGSEPRRRAVGDGAVRRPPPG